MITKWTAAALATSTEPGVTLDWTPGVVLIVCLVIATVVWHRTRDKPKADNGTQT